MLAFASGAVPSRPKPRKLKNDNRPVTDQVFDLVVCKVVSTSKK
jgi:hypothetical protein